MLKERMAELVNQVYRLTIEGKLTWEFTSEPSTYMATIPLNTDYSFVVTIESSSVLGRNPNKPNVVLEVWNYRGKVIDSVTRDDLELLQSEEADHLNDQPTLSEQLVAIYENAKRSDLGTDRILDDLIGDLKRLTN
jgi:hypothetical protein